MNSLDGLSLIGLILEADFIIKIVLLFLLMASVFSWMLVFNKLSVIRSQFKKIDNFEKIFFSTTVLDKIYEQFRDIKNNAVVDIFVSGLTEFKNLPIALDGVSKINCNREYVVNAMKSEYNKIMQELEDDVDILATIASVSPFVGLFGTVWGIINSFKSIAMEKNTSLLVVAPSIAEALFATAVGLFVAIPASIFYNRISSNLNKLSFRLLNFINDFSVILMKKM